MIRFHQIPLGHLRNETGVRAITHLCHLLDVILWHVHQGHNVVHVDKNAKHLAFVAGLTLVE